MHMLKQNFYNIKSNSELFQNSAILMLYSRTLTSSFFIYPEYYRSQQVINILILCNFSDLCIIYNEHSYRPTTTSYTVTLILSDCQPPTCTKS